VDFVVVAVEAAAEAADLVAAEAAVDFAIEMVARETSKVSRSFY